MDKGSWEVEASSEGLQLGQSGVAIVEVQIRCTAPVERAEAELVLDNLDAMPVEAVLLVKDKVMDGLKGLEECHDEEELVGGWSG